MSLCSPVRKRLSDAIDGEKLPFPMSAYVGMHRAICVFCRDTEKSLRQTKEAARALREELEKEK